MNKKDLENIRKIYETQVANGERIIKLNALMFRELLEHVETHNAKVDYKGKLPVAPEREC